MSTQFPIPKTQVPRPRPLAVLEPDARAEERAARFHPQDFAAEGVTARTRDEITGAHDERAKRPGGGEPVLQPADRYETSIQVAKQLAKQDPKMVAHVVKNWVGNE